MDDNEVVIKKISETYEISKGKFSIQAEKKLFLGLRPVLTIKNKNGNTSFNFVGSSQEVIIGISELLIAAAKI